MEAVRAFEELLPALLAIPEAELLPLRYTATEATLRGLWLSQNALRDLPRFEHLYKNPPLSEIRQMRTRALAIKGADLAAHTNEVTSEAPDIVGLRNLRDKGLAVLRAVFHADEAMLARVAAIEAGSGHSDLGSDAIETASLLRSHWDPVAKTGLVLAAEVESLDQGGVDVLRWAGRRGESYKSVNRENEQRAFTLMAQTYALIRDHAFLIWRLQAEVWQTDYPSLYSPSTGQKSRATGEKNSETLAASASSATGAAPDMKNPS